MTPFDTRSAVQRLLRGGMTEPEADAIVDVIGVLATKQDLQPLVTREELYRAIIIQTALFTGIVALVVALLTRL